jgi:putative membrane protein
VQSTLKVGYTYLNPMTINDLSTLNAILNFTSFILLTLGYRQIKAGNREGHKKFMLTAASCSTLFLISYLTYHYFVGSVKFQGIGWSRPVYFSILISHTILAACLVPMAILTLYRGLKGKFDLHKKISKKTWYVWMYVSVTGVIVYLMLYHIFR